MAKPVKFYYDFLSQHSRALYMFLEAAKIPYEPIPVSIKKGEHLTKYFNENINKLPQLPCINDDGLKLSESTAIFRYLMRDKLVPEHWYPRSLRTRAKIDEFLSWQQTNTRHACNLYYQTKWLKPLITGNEPDSKTMNELTDLIEKKLDILEKLWLSKVRHNKREGVRHYMFDKMITFAELLPACDMEQLRLAGYDPVNGRPKLELWLDLIKDTMSPFYEEAHQTIYEELKNSNNQLNESAAAKA